MTAFIEKAREQHPRLMRVLLFLVRFNLLALPLYLLLWTGFDPVWLRELNAWLTAGIIDLLGLEVSQSGTIVDTAHLSMDVSTDSTGWKSYIALSALLIAVVGHDLDMRLLGAGIGLLVVFIGNLMRLITMIYLVEVFGLSYGLVHDLFWRWGLTLLIFLYWVAWMQHGAAVTAGLRKTANSIDR